MTLDKRTRARLRAHCVELHADDGVDPREFFKPQHGARRDDRKARQLCRQVAETVDQVLAGETADELLAELQVESVVPAPDASRLLVTLRAATGEVGIDAEARLELEQRLAAHRGRLRCAVAAAITRRKAPNLEFRIVGPLADGEAPR
jgi:ribosome-binding factor A